jgi:predicted ATP-grasp superfamily ATP-dependent carboligase
MAKHLTIVGASARAAAFSARAAGFEPWCGDLFADVDLQAVATVERLNDYPRGLLSLLTASPNGPWIYTGALENYPDLIDELARLRPLYGNSGPVLRRARDPLFWSRALAERGLPAPRVSLSAAELPRDGTWICKPLDSANGQGVFPWTHAYTALAQSGDRRWYFQERIAGIPLAAVFVAADGESAILGVTQQLTGGDWRTAFSTIAETTDSNSSEERRSANFVGQSPFRYVGSLGPMVLEERHYQTIAQIGNAVARECGLVGLFGIDAVVNDRDVWPVEINPRYTASIEVLERASALRTQRRRPRRLLSLECHEAACCFRQLPAPLGQSDEVTSGKLIYYAERDCRFSRSASQWAVARNLMQSRPTVADIPASDASFRQGEPVLTLLADGPTSASVRAELTRAAEELQAMLE